LGIAGIGSYSRVDKGVTVGSCNINRLIFADDLVLLASFQQGLQHTLEQFFAACDRAGMKIVTKIPRYDVSLETKAVASGRASGSRFEISAPPFHIWPPGCYIHPVLYFKNVAPFWFLAPSVFLLPPAAKSWRRACQKPKLVYAASERQYTAARKKVPVPMGGIYVTSDGIWSEEIDTRIGEANAVVRELYRSVVMKRGLSNTAKLSVFKSVCVPIPTYGHESWLMTEIILSQVQAAKQDFCEECEVTQGHIEVRGRSGQKRNLVPPCSNLRYFGNKCNVLKEKRGTLLGLFGDSSDSAPGTRDIVLSCPRRYATGVALHDKVRSC